MFCLYVILIIPFFNFCQPCDQILSNCCFLKKSGAVVVIPPPYRQFFPPENIEKIQYRNLYTIVYFQNECEPVWGKNSTFAYLPNLVEFYWNIDCKNLPCLNSPHSLKKVSFHGRNECLIANCKQPFY